MKDQNLPSALDSPYEIVQISRYELMEWFDDFSFYFFGDEPTGTQGKYILALRHLLHTWHQQDMPYIKIPIQVREPEVKP